MEKAKAYFVGIDGWNRPVFKEQGRKNFYCVTDKLYSYGETPEQSDIDKCPVVYKGSTFEAEPNYAVDDVMLIVTKN